MSQYHIVITTSGCCYQVAGSFTLRSGKSLVEKMIKDFPKGVFIQLFEDGCDLPIKQDGEYWHLKHYK